MHQAQWRFQRDGRTYGPVSTEQIQELCRAGVIRADTRVHSTLFDRWLAAAVVPALRAAMSAMSAQAQAVDAATALRGIPSQRTRRSWYRFHPLNETASAWLIGLLLLAAIGVGVFNGFHLYRSARVELRIGAAAGSATAAFMVSLFLGWAAASIASLLSRRHRGVTVAAFAIASAVGIFTAGSAQLRLSEARHQQVQTSATEIRSFLKDVRNVTTEDRSSDRAAASGASSATQPATMPSTEARRIADVGRDVMADLLAARTRYETAVKSAKLDEILRPDHLADKSCYAAARQQLTDVRRGIDAFETETARVWAGVERRLIAAGVSAPGRRGFMSGLNSSRAQSGKAFAQVLALERQTLRQSEAILNFLEPRLTRVRLSSDGQLVFMSKPDADTHDRNVTQLLATIQQEQRLQAQNRDTALKKLDELADTVEHP